MVEVWNREKDMVILNYCNPCKTLEFDRLLEVQLQDRHRVKSCGDLNAHNIVWGGRHLDVNGQVVEALLEEKELVCLNDGRGTRVDVHMGREAVLEYFGEVCLKKWIGIGLKKCARKV